MEILTLENSTSKVSNYETTVETLLAKKSTKYDIYFFLSGNTKISGPHFVRLEEWFSEEYIDMFDSEILSTACNYNGHIVGLVIIYLFTYLLLILIALFFNFNFNLFYFIFLIYFIYYYI